MTRPTNAVRGHAGWKVAAAALLIPGALVLVGTSPAGAADGALDSTFGTSGVASTAADSTDSIAMAVAVQPDGKIVAAGQSDDLSRVSIEVVRYNTDGSPDSTFDDDGVVKTAIGAGDARAYAIAVQPDGKIIVVGASSKDADANRYNFDLAVVRYNTDGSLDSSFSGDGILTTTVGAGYTLGSAVALQTDGKIVLGAQASNGSNSDFAVVRLNTDGSFDTTFDSDGSAMAAIGPSSDDVFAVAVQGDGKILAAGRTNDGSGDMDIALARFNADGSLDTGFGTAGLTTTSFGDGYDGAASLALQNDGKIVVAGTATVSSIRRFAVVRYTSTGALDTGFGTAGKATTAFASTDDHANAVAIQADGKIVAAGASNNGTANRIALVRYRSNGAVDTTFGTAGKTLTAVGATSWAAGLAIQDDGRIVAAGKTGSDTSEDIVVVRYTGSVTSPTVAEATPGTGPIVGGTRISVTGRGFAMAGTVKVTIRGKACTQVTVVSTRQLTCITPALSAGASTIKVTNPNKRSGSKAKAFTHLSVLARPQTYWTRQFGGSGAETASAVATGPGGDIWVYGQTASNLDGSLQGAHDVFLARYSKTGTLKWLRQFGTSGAESPSQRLVVLPSGEAVITGNTTGQWPNETRKGTGSDEDVFVAKVSAAGALVWAHQYGTASKDYGRSIARSAAGDLYVVVETNDVFPSGSLPANVHGGGTDATLMKLTKNGVLAWARQMGGPAYDGPWDVAVSKRGEIYLTGTTYGDLDGPGGTLCNRPTTPSPTVGCHAVAGASDPFLVRLDAKGAVVWALQTAYTGGEEVWGIATGPNGDVYIDGYVYDEFIGTVGTTEQQGQADGFVSRYTKNGVLVWTHQLGTGADDDEWNLSIGSAGQVYVAGYTEGAFAGYTNLGGVDAYVRTISADGKQSTVQQFSTDMHDAINSFGSVLTIAPGGGLVFVTTTQGTTWGALPATSADISVSYIPVPGANKGVTATEWYAQLGGSLEDLVAAVQSDSKNNTYVFGQTQSLLEPGQVAPTGGHTDAYLAKYGPSGDLLWVRQFGTAADEYPGTQIAIDGAGDVYVEGTTRGAFVGQLSAGSEDAFVAKFTKNGALVWVKQYGTTAQDQAWGLAISPSGDLYAAIETKGTFPSGSLPAGTYGDSWDSVLMKLDRKGTLKWAAQFGEAGNDAAWTAVVNKQGEPFVLGTTNGTIDSKTASGANDGFVAKFDKNGNRQWVKLYGGAGDDGVWGGGVDRNGNLYLTGVTDGNLGTVGTVTTNQGGGGDAFVMKIAASGTLLWTHQMGTAGYELSQHAVVAANGWVYASGTTTGANAPYSQRGNGDVYVEAISPDGATSRYRQFGTKAEDGSGTYALPIALRPNGTLVFGTQPAQSPWGGGSAHGRDLAITAIKLP